MTVDEIIKLMLASGITISLVGISYQIMRLIGSVTDNLQDLRRAVQNIGKATDMVLEDYNEVRGVIKALIRLITNIQETILVPLQTVAKYLGKMRSKGDSQDEERLEDVDASS